jgi:hypothetical protein
MRATNRLELKFARVPMLKAVDLTLRGNTSLRTNHVIGPKPICYIKIKMKINK